MSWVLIIAMYTSNGIGMTSIPNFSTLNACEAAAHQFKTSLSGARASTSCIKVK